MGFSNVSLMFLSVLPNSVCKCCGGTRVPDLGLFPWAALSAPEVQVGGTQTRVVHPAVGVQSRSEQSECHRWCGLHLLQRRWETIPRAAAEMSPLAPAPGPGSGGRFPGGLCISPETGGFWRHREKAPFLVRGTHLLSLMSQLNESLMK